MRYTIDKAQPHVHIAGLFRLLDNGNATAAWAAEQVCFADCCKVTGGEFHGGEFHGGVFHGGEFHGGEFHGGRFHGGEFHGGEFHGGEFHGGRFHGGEFHGGEFHGGVFHGGWFHGGEFHGGVFHGGWLPLRIQGSQHFVNAPDGKTIRIGCEQHTPEYWLEHYAGIGRKNGYTPEQVQEYKRYIDVAAAMIADNAK
jgi:hypothetical protein